MENPVQKLTVCEFNRVADMQKWAVYSERYPLHNAKGRIKTFELCNLTKFDLFLVMCDTPRVIFNTGEVVMGYEKQFEKRPPIMFCGEFADLCLRGMSKLGFDETWLRQNSLLSSTSDLPNEGCEDKKICVISERGATLLWAYEMKEFCPNSEIYFYVPTVEIDYERIFSSENITWGYCTDLVIANIMGIIKRGQADKEKLPQEKIDEFPLCRKVSHTLAEIEKTIKGYIHKKYVYGLCNGRYWHGLGYNVEEMNKISLQRYQYIKGYEIDGRSEAPGDVRLTKDYQEKMLSDLIDKTLDEWFICGKYPF